MPCSLLEKTLSKCRLGRNDFGFVVLRDELQEAAVRRTFLFLRPFPEKVCDKFERRPSRSVCLWHPLPVHRSIQSNRQNRGNERIGRKTAIFGCQLFRQLMNRRLSHSVTNHAGCSLKSSLGSGQRKKTIILETLSCETSGYN